MSLKALKKSDDRISEMDRILCLPQDLRTPEDAEGLADLVAEYTDRFKQPDGKWTLRPVQALALDVLAQNSGCVAGIAVGLGKTLISALAPKVLGIAPFKTVLLTRAKLIEPWLWQYQEYREHFKVDRNLHLISYSKLSHPDEGPILLDRLRPDLIIADEAQALANEDSSRRNRFAYYFEKYPETKLLAMSGTLTNRSIQDVAHLMQIALGEGTPLPRSWTLMESFCKCLDPQPEGQFAKMSDWGKVSPLNIVYGDGRDLRDIESPDERKSVARKAYHERVRTTPGIVQTALDTVAASLQIEPIMDLAAPRPIADAIRKAEKEYILPNGDEIEDPLHKARAIKQIVQGVFYFWDWPGEPDWKWVDARRRKSKEIRRAIKQGPREIDSPTLVKRAIARGGVFDHDEELLGAWKEWQPHREKDPPPTRPEWIDEYLIDDVIKRARKWGKRPPAIIWYQDRFVADRLAEKGLTWYDPEDGRNPEGADPADGPIVLSIDSHVEGLNMQKKWSRNIVLCPPTGATVWEQLIGRTHRSGQEEDLVIVEVYAHVQAYRDALKKALKNARFHEQAEGQQRKLLIADWTKRIP